MIRLSQVSKIYPPGTAALKNINLQVEQGEFVFLTGASGAGKTTLLKLLFREEELSEGEIIIAGQNVTRLKRRGVALLRHRIGLVFGEIKFLSGMTAVDNVELCPVYDPGGITARLMWEVLSQMLYAHAKHRLPAP